MPLIARYLYLHCSVVVRERRYSSSSNSGANRLRTNARVNQNLLNSGIDMESAFAKALVSISLLSLIITMGKLILVQILYFILNNNVNYLFTFHSLFLDKIRYVNNKNNNNNNSKYNINNDIIVRTVILFIFCNCNFYTPKYILFSYIFIYI